MWDENLVSLSSLNLTLGNVFSWDNSIFSLLDLKLLSAKDMQIIIVKRSASLMEIITKFLFLHFIHQTASLGPSKHAYNDLEFRQIFIKIFVF